jgi:hypothetical protein
MMGIGLDLMWNDANVSHEDKMAITKAFIEQGSVRRDNKELQAILEEIRERKYGTGSTSEYMQGRWDMIGEVEDIILARIKEPLPE